VFRRSSTRSTTRESARRRRAASSVHSSPRTRQIVRVISAFVQKVRVGVRGLTSHHAHHVPPAVQHSESIASEGKGEYMYVEGHVRDTSGAPIPGAVIETWEADDKGQRNTSSVPPFSLTDASGVSQKVSTIPSTQIALSQTAVVGS
jgi:protocatechuate 3,4-dioxygenase beta subunit